jgi:hypothetical protein
MKRVGNKSKAIVRAAMPKGAKKGKVKFPRTVTSKRGKKVY